MVDYEWDVETTVERTTEEHDAGDVIDHHHCASFTEALLVADRPAPEGCRHAIVLVRDDDNGRSWSYLEDDGALAVYFTDASGREIAKVPHRFIREVSP